MSKKVAIYPRTFDPITNGHFDVIERASAIFDKVYIAIAQSESKKPMFDLKTRVEMAKEATKDITNVEVISFCGLLVECCRQKGAKIIVRGLRAVSDFEYELQMGYANSSLDKNINTLYFMPNLENAFISSSIVRELIKFNGDFGHLVPNIILKELKIQYIYQV